MAAIAESVYSLIKETVEAQGVSLWDVKFLKEGASRYLRVFIDRPGGVSIDDCSNVSRAIDPVIDEADPIDTSYYLEVCSPGTERELTRAEHFKAMAGRRVKVKLFKAVGGSKELTGILLTADDAVVIKTDGGELRLEKPLIAKVSLSESDSEDYFGGITDNG